jgi:hypothetical protein
MDSQWNSLIQSYHSNYVQHKITGNPSYEKGYISAQDGLTSILNSMLEEVDKQQASISKFYKDGAEQKVIENQQKNHKLQRGLIFQNDKIKAAQIRNETPSLALGPPIITTGQIIGLSVSGAVMLGLLFL